ncbi:MHYT domain-containing protein [Actinomadura sp. NBRC 104412]|uniref:MHYT domain-containing protein n=1 Tax=Actinomadura sp. NBRC 104412 TaxID=3032203 RepID=UPI00255761F8|nr:MHYT domain-containing protein [Actinomadura sp. NBRC 104412]
MSQVHHFSYGVLTPVAAYVMSFIGSLIGLQCTSRARAASGLSRASWLALAAVAIGGTGIWVMHFIAMLGFTVSGMEIRYDVGLTLLSAVIAIAVVGVGTFMAGFGGPKAIVVLPAGFVTGLGVAAMHYTGMAAMNLAAEVSYTPGIVLLSVLIAVVAATAALWFTLRVRGTLATGAAAMIMGVAVSGMHYTGMAALNVRPAAGAAGPTGAGAIDLLMPLVVGVSVVAVVLLVIVTVFPGEAEMVHAADLDRRTQELARRREPAAPSQEAPAPRPQPKKTTNQWFDA